MITMLEFHDLTNNRKFHCHSLVSFEVSVSVSDVEALLKISVLGNVGNEMLKHAQRKTSVIGNVGKDMLNHARRKYESNGLEKHLKLRQFFTRLRLGRFGYLLLVFAALGTLTVPLMFQDALPAQLDQDLARDMNAQYTKESRGVDEPFNRKIKLAEEKIIYEEGKESSEIVGNEHGHLTGVSDTEKSEEDELASKGKTAALLVSEDVKLSDPAQLWRKPDQTEGESSEVLHVPFDRKSEVDISGGRTERQHKRTPSKASRRRRNRSKHLSVVEEEPKRAHRKNEAGFHDRRSERGDKVDSHATVSSVEAFSSNSIEETSNIAPPGAHFTNDTEGSSNGFNEAFKEVLKLASEANQTAGKNSVHLQEKNSVTESLSADKSAELDVQAIGSVDVVSQKLSEEREQTAENGTLASVGLNPEEHDRDISVHEGKDIELEVSHSNQTESTSAREEGAIETLEVVPVEEKNNPQIVNLSDKMENSRNDESQTSTANSGSEGTTTAGDTKINASDSREDVGSSNESNIVQGSDPVVDVVEPSREANNHLQSSSAVDGGKLADSMENNKNTPDSQDEGNSKVTGAVDGSSSEEHEMQTEVRQENSNELPQESVIISSLRQRAASGTLRSGLLNVEAIDLQHWQFLAGESPIVVPLERVNEGMDWTEFYPEWIDEEEKYGTPKCPAVPMPKVSSEVKLDMVIARASCSVSSSLHEVWKQPASLQVLLGAASLAVNAGNGNVYVLILSECRPLVNLFSCGELLEHRDQGWLYQVNIEQLRKRISMPVGSCQLSIPLEGQDSSLKMGDSDSQKEAYATILHSGSDYVCGAIATAHSIRKSGSTRDLVILVDSSISPEQRQALQEAGWKVRDLERVYKSYTVEGKQYERDFSRFRLWQLTEYNKVIYVEADVLVLRNLDHLFTMPEISASGSTKTLFNSGVMVIEPSSCTFQLFVDEMEKSESEIGGDWDFFNRIFPWWHRIPRHMNYLKYFWTRSRTSEVNYSNRLFSSDPPQLYAIHYWGYKPWQCFRDYDCNWNSNQHFASDEAHARWFKVYDELPENLQKHCALSTGTKAYLEHNRRTAEAAALEDKHWAITIKDPRLNVCQEGHCDWKALLSIWDKTVNTTSAVVVSTR
ncbi:uncharacterized protein [Physcomitrium patens]|uniref:uncharacterized protein isoform X3 n=1 Tax=Physcomitrium patens TaxID=3218 RepID=UPI000D17D19F|nr:uncharacterized protein LOC112290517 isoform X3 [Physcomitrium patens]|eukprot:XP_024392627.1 uncharacterized protein LOC112290517 isoform X3 [Physcomitrella patens]